MNNTSLNFQDLLDNFSDGVIIQSKAGEIIYANKTAAVYCGFPSTDKLITVNTKESLMKSEAKDGYGKPYNINNSPARQIFKGKLYAEDFIYFNNLKNNKQTCLLIKATPIYNKKKLTYALIVLHDITGDKNLEKRKDIFIAMASHELKSLLTSIKAYIQLLQRSFSSNIEKSSNYLIRLDGQVNKLTSLITDLLDLSRMRTGNFQLNKEKVNLKQLLTEIISDVQVTTLKHKIILNIDDNKEINIDKKRISEVVINFLTNAIKYAPNSKKIIVSVEYKETVCKISVEDFGKGIKKTDQSKIFDLFYQLDKNNNAIDGLGIGLFISKNIINAHSGKIGVKSTLNKGSIFYFEIPIN